MKSQLQQLIESAKAPHSLAKVGANAVDIVWPFHSGDWLKNAPKTEKEIRASYMIPGGISTNEFISKLYGFPKTTKWKIVTKKLGGGWGINIDVHIDIKPPKFISDIYKTAGRALASAAHLVDHVTGDIKDEIAKIPFIGKPLADLADIVAAGFLLPFQVAGSLIFGQGINQAVMNNLRREVSDFKTVGPYAEMVLSEIPGVGTVISGGIAAALALANGQPITTAMLDAVKAAIPGGPIVKAVYSATVSVVKGENLAASATALIDATGVVLPDVVKKAIEGGLSAVEGIAKGQKVDTALADSLLDAKSFGGLLPKTVTEGIHVAVSTAIALAHGQNLQKVAADQLASPGLQDVLGTIGGKVLDPITKAARGLLPNGLGVHGFNAAIGLVSAQIGPVHVQALRASLSADDKRGFDMAASLHVGKVTNVPNPKVTAAYAAGNLMAHGMRALPIKNRVVLLKTIAANPQAAEGAHAAVAEITQAKKTFWWMTAGIGGVIGVVGGVAVGLAAAPVVAVGAATALGAVGVRKVFDK